MNRTESKPFVRDRRGHAKVTNEELFFDLIYAFAITQLSHRLLDNLTPLGATQTLVLWFAVWLGWQYTCWVTNWFNPENLRMRLMLFALMLVGLAMSATIPAAFAEAGLAFALCFAAIQVGRTVFVLVNLPRGHALLPNFRRILGWVCISAALWIAGGLSEGSYRLAFWIAAVLSEYVAPMIGFALPVLGRSATTERTIEGSHLAERNQLFVMIALGESILATGGSFSQSPHLDAPTLIALFVAFAGSVAMWWIYFDTASEHGTRAIKQSDDPGRIGAYFHYVHVTLIAGIIVAAVADELVIHHPGSPHGSGLGAGAGRRAADLPARQLALQEGRVRLGATVAHRRHRAAHAADPGGVPDGSADGRWPDHAGADRGRGVADVEGAFSPDGGEGAHVGALTLSIRSWPAPPGPALAVEQRLLEQRRVDLRQRLGLQRLGDRRRLGRDEACRVGAGRQAHRRTRIAADTRGLAGARDPLDLQPVRVGRQHRAARGLDLSK